MTENKYFQIGKVLYPLQVTTNLPVNDIDPVLAAIIDFFPAVINDNCLAYWNANVVKCAMDEFLNKMVAQSLPYDPLPLREENEWKFPLLAAFPFGTTTYELDSLHKYSKVRMIQVNYILPSLQSDQAEYLYPMLTAIEDVIADRLHDGFEADYGDGTSVWANTGLNKIELIDSVQGKIPGYKGDLNAAVNIFFPSVSFTLKVKEQKKEGSENFLDFSGMDASIDEAFQDEATLPDFIQVRTDD